MHPATPFSSAGLLELVGVPSFVSVFGVILLVSDVVLGGSPVFVVFWSVVGGGCGGALRVLVVGWEVER